MEQRLSAVDERKLTNAIEKAATLASLDDSKDRNELLAAQLKEAGVDKCMAKVASCAFNKRVTVLTFQKTADEHRAEPFALTDGDVVYKLLGGETQEKTASVQPVKFYIGSTVVEVPMQKTASVQTMKKPNYEDTVSAETFSRHLESMIQKQAAEFSELSGKYESLESDIKERTQRLADYFQKSACSSFEFTTLNNYFGDAFKETFSAYLPESTDFSKTASACILGTSAVYKDTEKLIEDRKNLKVLGDYIGSYSKGLAEFCKSAAAYGDAEQKYLFNYQNKNAAVVPAGAIARGIGMDILLGASAIDQIRDAGQTAMLAGFDNARNMYNAGRSVGMAPGDVLDSEFLVKDRYRDRMLGWSDIAADPQFKLYPANQVFQATQKAMDMDGSLERPDRREVLRAQVSQLLAQNNRASTADIAALATTLKALAGSAPNPAAVAAEKVYAMDKVDRPDPVEFKHMLEAAKPYVYDPSKAMSDIVNAETRAQDRELQREQRAEDAAARQKADAEALARQDRLRSEDRANYLADKATEAQARADQRNAEHQQKIDDEKDKEQRQRQQKEREDDFKRQQKLHDAEVEMRRRAAQSIIHNGHWRMDNNGRWVNSLPGTPGLSFTPAEFENYLNKGVDDIMQYVHTPPEPVRPPNP